MNEKLKPVVFVKGRYSYNRQDKFKQNLLLKALQVTTDPQKLKEMIGVKSVAEVYRTLDKLAIRKEYHSALALHGLDLGTIVGGIKKIVGANETSVAIKLKGYQTLLKSLGLDRYDEDKESSGSSWEDLIVKMSEAAVLNKEEEVKELPVADYEVIAPETPKEEGEKRKKEEEIGKSLYE